MKANEISLEQYTENFAAKAEQVTLRAVVPSIGITAGIARGLWRAARSTVSKAPSTTTKAPSLIIKV